MISFIYVCNSLYLCLHNTLATTLVSSSMELLSDLSGLSIRESPAKLGGGKMKGGMRRVYSLQEATGAHDGGGGRVGDFGRLQRSNQSSQSMKVITNQRGARKLLPRHMERHLQMYAKDEDEFDVYASDTAMPDLENEEDDDASFISQDSSVYSNPRYQKFFEPVLKNRKNGDSRNSKSISPKKTRRRRQQSSIKEVGPIEYPASLSLKEDREKIRLLEERLERIERAGGAAAAQVTAPAPAKKKMTRPAAPTKPSPFIAHIPKFGRQLPEKEKKNNRYMLPRIFPDEDLESGDPKRDKDGVKVRRSEQIEKDKERGKAKAKIREPESSSGGKLNNSYTLNEELI